MKIQIIAAVIGLGILSACNFQQCREGTTCIAGTSGPSPIASITPVPIPSPSPSPLPVDSACEASCKVHSIVIDESASVIAMGATQVFNMTPFTEVNICDVNGKPTQNTKLVKTSKDCDDPRAGAVSWVSSTNALEITNLGFRAEVKRRATGESILTVSLDGKSYSRPIR